MVYAFFTKRRFRVSQLGIKSYVVTQFHYTTWPDHETLDPLCLVIFHNHVANETVAQGISPTLVHCSTGTGRTGTYIALDYLYKTGKMSGSVNVAEYVKTMRENRMNMVETFNQYVAVFLALQEAFQAQPALQSKKQFLNKVTSLMKKGNMISASLKEEHEILKKLCSTYTDVGYNAAKQHMANSGKDAVLLADKYRPQVTSTVLARGSFINAIVASTYTKDNGFIITQYPSHDNVVEFIRLIVDYECRTVICLDPLHHIKSSKAWMPSPSSEMAVSPYRVSCSTCKDTGLTVSTLYIHKEKEEPFCVTVAEPKYEFGSKLQNDVTCLCTLVSFALNRPGNSPIAVISMDGASMCGVFCAVFNSIQQITMDDNIDVLTTVRQLQTRRPELCATQDEYGLIYQTIYDYLQDASEYVCFD
nr:receptor-type tyrosine-protein phosphatase alpha [Crassostrea gigas]